MRGWEPVKFVDNVLNYHKIIAWHQQQEEFRIATANTGNRLSANTAVDSRAADDSGNGTISRSMIGKDSAALSVL